MIENTFLTVTWNNESTIERLIKSIKNYENSKLIIVDNNSNDRTVEIARKYSNVDLIALKQNLGFSKANNIGFKKVNTKYVTFLNPDTFLVQNVSNYLIREIENGKIGLIGAKLVNSNGAVQPSIYKFQNPLSIFIEQFRIGKILPEKIKVKISPENSKHDKKRYVDWLIGAFYFTKSKYYKEIGGFSEDYFLYAEDMDICYKYHLHDYKVLFTPEITVCHIGGESEKKTNTSKSLKLLNSFCIFAHKYNLESNIKSLYFSYKFKKIIFFFNNRLQRHYDENIKFLKGKI